MSKYIDADKLKRHYAWWDDETKKIFDEIIDLQPAADVEEVRHGRWIIDEWDTPNCSVCGCSGIDDYYATPYCPHCGAKMDEVDE